jgi:pilus assembly protein CpaC
LKLGQSIVLSGIRSSAQTRSASGLPGLSQIPILGALFGSQTGSSNDLEGAVFIIPSIVESVPRKAHNIVELAMKQYADYSGDIETAAAFSHAPPNFK